MTPPLALKDCSAGYGKFTVFSGVDLELREGEIFGLIGLNGVGKTTLIKAILDLGPLVSGSIRIFGAAHDQPGSRLKLAYLPDRFQPSGNLRGIEFLSLAVGYFGRTLAQGAAELRCSELGLDPDILERPIRTYSKGMGQKLALAATFLTERPLIILDEPMTGLDPLARVQLKSQLLAYRSRGHSIFFSSHILSDIEEICDSIGVFNDGAMRFLGAPGELVRQTGAGTLEDAFLQAIGATVAEAVA